MMGVMGVFKWLRQDIVQRDRNRRSLTPKINGLNNDAYRNALQAFIDRRRNPNESGCIISPNSPDKERLDFFNKKTNENEDKKRRNDKWENKMGMPGIPHVEASDIFEIGWIAGTEDRYMELMFAEWQTTRVSLRRHTHPDCRNAVKADLEVLTEIRHPNILLLMGTTRTDDHGLVAIFEPVDCTLYNFVHEQGERVSVQGIAKCAGNLAAALKHAHMRGYVHGALSSHCIFLATCGTVKLGGWELARSPNNQKSTREYEQRLRYEIFRWQAPEIFKGQEPSKATDVYGLALIMWEMCTMNIPWNGLSKSEVERQYVQWEKGVITDLYNFPPLLRKLLDAGLQLDVSKRTLDMSRMRRFLQTLEIQHEKADPIYIETSTNNNNNNNPIKLLSKGEANRAFESDSPSSQKYSSAPTPKRYSESKTSEAKGLAARTLNLNLVENPEKPKSQDILPFGRNETGPADILENVLKTTSSVQRANARNVNKASPKEKLSNASKQRHARIGEKKLSREVEHLVAKIPHDSTDDELTSNDTRGNIQKLRQALATKRKDFFYGSDSSQFSPPEENTFEDSKFRLLPEIRSKDYEPLKPTNQISRLEDTTLENTKFRMLMEVRSKDYEPHKPASHKTSLELKQNKSPGQYNSSSTRSATHKSQKSPYSYVPTAVRDAVVQPKVLNSNSQSFFESSLWRKEKLICISKMRKNYIDDSTFRISRNSHKPNEVSIDNDELRESNETYTIDDQNNSTANPGTNPSDSSADLTANTNPRSRSLQALKESLERATEIVLSTNNQEDSTTTVTSSPPKTPETFDPNTSVHNESVFEDLYDLKHDGSDSEIKDIERSNGVDTIFFPSENKRRTKENSDEITVSKVRDRSTIRDDAKRSSFDLSRMSSVVCESIAESSNENEHSSSDSKRNDGTVILSRSSETAQPQRSATFELGEDEPEIDNQEEPETSFALMVFSDKNRGCHSCNTKSNLPRRRSLPAALGQLRNLSNVSLGKLPIRKGDVPDNTVEDIYIDDEFGDSLNVNMVLLDGETDDEDFLPDLELSDAQEYL